MHRVLRAGDHPMADKLRALRVLHVIPSVALAHGGPSRAINMLECALEGSGVTMEVAATDDDGPGRRMAASFGADGIERGREGGLPIRRFFPKRSEFYKVSPGLAVWLVRHSREYDVVHIHTLFSFSSIAAAWAARRVGVPYIVRPLGTLNRYGVEQRRPWLKRLSLRFVEGPILRGAAAVHFTAEDERREAEQLGIPLRGVVIPLAVEPPPVVADEATFCALFPTLRMGRYVLFMSRLDPKKNVEGLREALALLAAEHSDLVLAVAGGGEPAYVASLKRHAGALGVADRVVWTGFLDGAQKAAALAGARVFVLPSYSENFGIAAAEALLAGLPCVLGRGVAIAAEVEAAGAGLAVEPVPAAVAAALDGYLRNETVRASAGEAARRFASQSYSMAAMRERLVALYRSLC